jgi:curli biogenesis system outer membrane secretion channel CsgG
MQQKMCCFIFVPILLTLIGCSPAEKISSTPAITCSILMLESRSGMNPGEAESVTDMFASALQNTGRFTVVERNKLSALLQEKEFQSAQSGEDAAEPEKIISVKKMFSGSIGMLGKKYVLSIKMIDVSTSQIEYARTWTYDEELESIGENFLPNIAGELINNMDNPAEK